MNCGNNKIKQLRTILNKKRITKWKTKTQNTMNKDKLEFKLNALVTVCRQAESKEQIANYIMECADDIMNLFINPNNTSEVCGHYFAATKNGFLPCEFCSEPHPTYPTTTVK